jgi:flagellar motor switch protein FliN/FliY
MAAPGLEAGATETPLAPAAGIVLLPVEEEVRAVDPLHVAQRMEANPAWPMISRLAVSLAARIPINRFRVRDLLVLAPGQTIITEWAATEDVPLLAGDLQVGWSEFEVVGRKMALRVTRLV